MHLPDGVPCGAHPAVQARAVCPRCGTYACDDCLAGGMRADLLCASCDEQLAAGRQKSVATPALVLRALLCAFAALSLGAAGMELAGVHMMVDPMAQWVTGTMGAMQVSCMVCWVVWFRRANKSLRERGMQLEYGSNAWAWFFVPIVWFWKPYSAVAELYQRANDTLYDTAWMRWWWGLWIVGLLVTPNNWRGLELEGFDRARDIFGTVLTLGAALLAQEVVDEITRALAKPRPRRRVGEAWSEAFR